MEPHTILYADPLDILFENRNKLYGAYPLRKFYPQRLWTAMGIMFSLVVVTSFLFLSPESSSVLSTKRPENPDVNFTEVILQNEPKPLLPPVKPSVPKAPVASLSYTKPLIVADRLVKEAMPDVDKIDGNQIGLKTSPGVSESESPIAGTNEAAVMPVPTDAIENKNEILDRAEIMPEFPGGTEALKKFLIKNLRMPENNLEEGAQMKVIARFVVGSDGRVRNIEITLPADVEFDAEVKRVIAKMPDWKPGSQNHRNVAVYFSLPVNFVRSE